MQVVLSLHLTRLYCSLLLMHMALNLGSFHSVSLEGHGQEQREQSGSQTPGLPPITILPLSVVLRFPLNS